MEYWVRHSDNLLPGYSVVEGAHWGVACVLRCGLAADGQFVVLILKQFKNDIMENNIYEES